MNKIKKYLFFLSLLIFLSCSIKKNLANLSLVSTKEIKQADLKNPISEEYKLLGYVEGEATTHIIVVVPTGPSPRIDDAIQNTLNKYGADYLTNARISQENLYIPYIGGYSSILVEGQGWVHEDNYSTAKDAYLSSQSTKKSNNSLSMKIPSNNIVKNYFDVELEKSSKEKSDSNQSNLLDTLKTLPDADSLQVQPAKIDSLQSNPEDTLKNETINKPRPVKFDPETGEPIYE